ncbi:MAG: FAD-dependent monooxygenase [Proteobacteria bacterium]|nr:FAD-dependent monooxygenase [Pseudomonadota bacterium]
MYKIAIVGAGTAGLAAAALLKKQGYQVTLYEKFLKPKPLGAGLLLQPTGLSVLSLLNLDQSIIAGGSVINCLQGKTCGSKWKTLDIHYHDLSPHLFGVGVYRNNLFNALYHEVEQSGIQVISASTITHIEWTNDQAYVINTGEAKTGPYDLIVDCSGSRSQLRKKYANVKLDKLYPFGAIWGIVKLKDNQFSLNTLEQRYRNADHMIGILPVGQLPGDQCISASFFWSMPIAQYSQWRVEPLNVWQRYVVSLWPECESLVLQFNSHDDLTLATYYDVILRQYYTGNLVFIGDAAHCTSPQLGQGANMALMDAYVLAECLKYTNSISQALVAYQQQRQKHLAFYQMASRILTPFFQSHSIFFARLRALIGGLAGKIPVTQKITAQLLSGIKTGLFSQLDPGQWSKKYQII